MSYSYGSTADLERQAYEHFQKKYQERFNDAALESLAEEYVRIVYGENLPGDFNEELRVDEEIEERVITEYMSYNQEDSYPTYPVREETEAEQDARLQNKTYYDERVGSIGRDEFGISEEEYNEGRSR